MNRIAWIGQAAMCYETGIPSIYCSGFNLLTEQQQDEANKVALKVLNKWLKNNGRDKLAFCNSELFRIIIKADGIFYKGTVTSQAVHYIGHKIIQRNCFIGGDN